jgi:uncharacterized protein YukE
MTGTVSPTEANQLSAEALALLNSITTGQWVAPLTTGRGLAALDATMRPIDELNTAGLSWLTPHVQPLQQVLDRLAGKAAVIQSFADAWRQAAGKVEEVRDQLARMSASETSEWRGAAADAYRRRARELTMALEAAAHVSMATGVVARQMGEAVADARQRANDLLTDLVRRLISYARQAIAAEGGVTPNVVAQCTSMIDSYRGPITEIEAQLERTLDSIQPPTIQPSAPGGPSTTDTVLDVISNIAGALNPTRVINGASRVYNAVRRIFGMAPRPGRQQTTRSQEVTEAEMIRAIRNSPKTQIGRVEPPTNVRPGENVGNVMHDRIERVVRDRWPDVQFRRTGLGERGPDMVVTGGRRNPGFDWVEIKPDTDSGISAFVRREWGRTPEWTGSGRIVTYDRMGNVYEIHFPARTGP